MNSEDERHKVARRLRALPTDLYDTLCELKAQGLYIDATLQDELDYSLIHNVLLGCFPAEHMHPCDYQELHERIADLIDPVCTVDIEPSNAIEHITRYTGSCSNCGDVFICNASETDAKQAHPNYCPNCGFRVVSSNE